MAEELEIVFTNESRKQFQAVLFPDDSNIDESFSLTWLVFDLKSQNSSLPSLSSIGFVSEQSTVGPVPAPSGSSWLLVKDGETIALTEGITLSLYMSLCTIMPIIFFNCTILYIFSLV